MFQKRSKNNMKINPKIGSLVILGTRASFWFHWGPFWVRGAQFGPVGGQLGPVGPVGLAGLMGPVGPGPWPVGPLVHGLLGPWPVARGTLGR